MSAAPTGTDLFPYTFATWVFTLHVGGVVAADAALSGACDAIRAAGDAAAGNAASESLVARVKALVPDGAPATVMAAARGLYGDRARSELGAGDRAERTARIRRNQFASQLPWLARIVERTAAGVVQPGWLLVERVTDEVTAADPNPWNDVDESRHLPLGDFLVLWELDGNTSVHIGG